MANIINVDFSNTGDRWLELARTARQAGDLPKALQLYRKALENNPRCLATGLELAITLWENAMWDASLRECCRLLSLFPGEEKLFGLIYRNALALGLDTAACYAYERYMQYLYHNPEGGLNLGESEPPIPKKPTRKRYFRLLSRATASMHRGQLDKANRLLMHAYRGAFPREDTLRELLLVNMLHHFGMDEEAAAIVDGLLEQRELDASQAIALMGLMGRLRGKSYAGRLLMYAAFMAQSSKDVRSTTAACLLWRNPSLARNVLVELLEETPYRMDCLYNSAIVELYDQNADDAIFLMDACAQLDPTDAGVCGMHSIMQDAMRNSADAMLPVQPYNTPAGVARCSCALSLIKQTDEQLRRQMTGYPAQCLLLDTLVDLPAPHLHRLLRIAATLSPADEAAFLRMCLLNAGLSTSRCGQLTRRLAALGETGEVTAMADGRLQTLPIPPADKNN